MLMPYFVEVPGDSILLQLGVGGIIAILVIREVLRFLKPRLEKTVEPQAETPAGMKSVEFWRAEIKDAVGAAMSEQLTPILDRQTEILAQMSETENQQSQVLVKLVTLVEVVAMKSNQNTKG